MGEIDNKQANKCIANPVIIKNKQYAGVVNNGGNPLNSVLKEGLSGLLSSIK